VLLYMVLHGSNQYTPVMLAYIPAPWIRHGIWLKSPITGGFSGPTLRWIRWIRGIKDRWEILAEVFVKIIQLKLVFRHV
jgi:hypothetical protein